MIINMICCDDDDDDDGDDDDDDNQYDHGHRLYTNFFGVRAWGMLMLRSLWEYMIVFFQTGYDDGIFELNC